MKKEPRAGADGADPWAPSVPSLRIPTSPDSHPVGRVLVLWSTPSA